MAEPNRSSAQGNAPVINFRPGGGPGGPGRGPGGPMGARISGQKPKNLKKTAGRLLKYVGKNRFLILLLLVVMLISTAFELVSPALQGAVIDTISLNPATGRMEVNFSAMLIILGIMAAVFVLNALVTYVQSIVAARLSQFTVYTLRQDLFHKISRLPIGYTDSHKHGDIMSRMTNDVENVSNAVAQSLTSLVSSVLTLAGALVMMLYYSPIMTLVAFITVPITIVLSSTLAKYMRKYYVRQQKLLGQLNGQIEEMVTGYKTVVAYGKEQESVATFRVVSEDLRKTSISSKVWGSIMGPCMNILGNLQYLLIAAIGGYLVLNPINGMRLLTVGNVQSMLQYSKKFSRPLNMIANQYAQIMTALAGAERIFEIMDHPDEINEGTAALKSADVRGELDFNDIHFSYVPGQEVLKGLNLAVKPGQKIAIVGATGSGKTTIVNLLTRFYEVDSGEILLDGQDIRNIPKEDLRSAIAIVLQDTVLFADTIRANIKYGCLDATDEEMRAAAHMAKADEFIERLPDGYDTVLSEGGSNLSQGQRQLLSISRAVLADPRILILDEATSSVDTRTEMHIQQAMVALMKNRTSLIIAHRLSTIRDADVIVVVRDGVIAEAGNHEQLLAAGGEYHKLYQNQFAGIAT